MFNRNGFDPVSDLECTEFHGDMLDYHRRLFTREKTYLDLMNHMGSNEYEFIPVRQEDVCVDISRTMRRLGLCKTTLNEYAQVQARALTIGMIVNSKYQITDAVREIIGHLNNISTKGYLLGNYKPLGCEMSHNISNMGTNIFVYSRPLVDMRGYDYIQDNLTYFVEEGQQFKRVDDF
jgi:hypothetical protein